MKKIRLERILLGQKTVFYLVETLSNSNRYCLKSHIKHYSDEKIISIGIYREFFATYVKMHEKYELIKKINIDYFQKIKEIDI